MRIVFNISKDDFFNMIRKTYPEVTNDSELIFKFDDDSYVIIVCNNPSFGYCYNQSREIKEAKEFDPAEIDLSWPNEFDDDLDDDDDWDIKYCCDKCEYADCTACSYGESLDNPGHVPGCDDWDECFGCWTDHVCIIGDEEDE